MSVFEYMKTQLLRRRSIVDRGGVTPCWEWTGKIANNGYGHVWVMGALMSVHRLSYELFQRPLTDGYQVCHKCDNPPCFNPEHLFAGTQTDNVQDSFLKGRAYRLSGELHPGAKLTQVQVNDMRALRASEKLTHKALAIRFGISQPAVSRILNLQHWK